MDKLLGMLMAQNFDMLNETQLDSIGIYLDNLQDKLNEAKTIIETKNKQEKWNRVKEAISAYMEAYGDIYIDDGCDGYYICRNSSFDECGEIVISD